MHFVRDQQLSDFLQWRDWTMRDVQFRLCELQQRKQLRQLRFSACAGEFCLRCRIAEWFCDFQTGGACCDSSCASCPLGATASNQCSSCFS